MIDQIDTPVVLNVLTDREERIIKMCLCAWAELFDDSESQTLSGYTNEEMQAIADGWPHNKNQNEVGIAVNNVLLWLLTYPFNFDVMISKHPPFESRREIRSLLDKITGRKRLPELYDRVSLIDYLDRGNTTEYVFFWENKIRDHEINETCFSQWYPSCFAIDQVIYPTAEHYMMAEKARLFHDDEALKKILASTSPSQAKKLGREIRNFDQMVWEKYKFDVVVTGNKAKFSQNSVLRKFLLSTDNRIIVEASPVDDIWGIGLAKNDPDASDPRKWKGLNLLGFALMKVRDQIYYT